MNRGSCASGRAGGSGTPRFNEAPIHESGKSSVFCLHIAVEYRSFNEAPIHESGKCQRGRRVGERRESLQ